MHSSLVHATIMLILGWLAWIAPALNWIKGINPQWIACVFSCTASVFAIIAYRSTYKKNKTP